MKNTIKEFVDAAIPKIVSELGLTDVDQPELAYDLESSENPSHGDVSINLAFRLAGKVKRPPQVVAELIKQTLDKEIKHARGMPTACIDRIEVAKPGFINFFLTPGAGNEILFLIRERDKSFGECKAGAGSKALIEFVSANPTGPLTVAHGRQAVVGDVLARLLDLNGYQVTREYYLNDSGRQIKLLGESVLSRYAEQIGSSFPFPEEGYKGSYIFGIARELVSRKASKIPLDDKGVAEAAAFAVNMIMGNIREDLERLSIVFDSFFSEKSLYGKKMEEALDLLARRGALYEMEGARWFKASEYGDEKDRVVKKSTGEYTYLAPDIAYHRDKFMRGNEILITLVGPDHHGYVPRLKGACKALGYDPDHLKLLIVQLVTLYRSGEPVRMSTRAGEFVTLRELMEEVGVDATRIFFVQRKIDSHLDFDIELAKKQSEENPVYYLQYAHARISSILAFAGRPTPEKADLSLLREPETHTLIKKLGAFPEQVQDAAHLLEPFRIFDYLLDLAQAFHKFYTLYRVVTPDNALTDARLILVDAARIVFRNGFAILGVNAPEKM